MPRPPACTEQEARERAALIEVERYDITVDVREPAQDGPRWLATSSITFELPDSPAPRPSSTRRRGALGAG